MSFGSFESLPIAVIYVLSALLMLAFCEVGYQFGVRVRTRQDKEAPTSLGPMVGGLLGMLAFVLAFTFSMAASQYDLRKKNVLDEANAIGTAYLRADLLDKQYGIEVKHLLREYVDVRLQGVRGHDHLDTALARSAEIHKLLWAQVSQAARASPSTNTALMVQSINDVIDMHEKRVTGALYNRIPGSVWIALITITALTMITMGMHVGFTGRRRVAALISLSLAFAMLVTLVVDLNRPQSGLITVGQQSMVDLQKSMRQDAK
jgi:cytochrome bd-type quinol oxidase subunit 2